MKTTGRNWRALLGGVAAATAAVIGFAGASASAEPVVPAPPAPPTATVTQTVTVTSIPATPAAEPSPATAAEPAPPAAEPSNAPLAPATEGTLVEFFKDKGVAMQPQKAAGFTALTIVLPVPGGWSIVTDPNVPDAFSVIADRKGGDGLYTSNAQLQVYKLVGDFDPREAISHGFVDSQKLRNWRSTSASMAQFGGFPSSVITGTFRDNDLTLNTTRRHVIATSGAGRYLVSLSVTTSANQAVATAPATDGILNGFRVADPAAAVPTAPAAPPAPAAPAPAPPAPPVPGAPAPLPVDPAAPLSPAAEPTP